MPVIEAINLNKSFAGAKAVADLNLCVEAGQLVALLGSNGAGKTTTISMLMGLTVPDSGRISILGHDMVANRFAALPFMNFSSPYVDLPPNLSVRDNLIVYGNLYGVPQLKQRMNNLIEDLHLEPFFHKNYGHLSAGQKTRVSLAKALINQPKVLLLDEPTASLDPDTADWVRRYISTYQKQAGASILMASHNMEEVERMADYVIIMHKGACVAQGRVSDLKTRYGADHLEAVFLQIVRGQE
jgi:ABC-2 type transport system ATP-binding protein